MDLRGWFGANSFDMDLEICEKFKRLENVSPVPEFPNFLVRHYGTACYEVGHDA